MQDKLLLAAIRSNARMKMADLAAILDSSEEAVSERLSDLEKRNIIRGYHTVINWDETNENIVTALIEIKATPEREYGYDRIASRIYKYQEVETMYLLSGDYDFVCIVNGHTMQEVANFVASRLACISGVTDTKTTFVLKPYKISGIQLIEDEDGKDTRLVVSL